MYATCLRRQRGREKVRLLCYCCVLDHHLLKMLSTSLLLLAFTAGGLAQTIPTGYRTVYITSAVDAKYVVVPKSATSGAAIVVWVSFFPLESVFLPLHGLPLR